MGLGWVFEKCFASPTGQANWDICLAIAAGKDYHFDQIIFISDQLQQLRQLRATRHKWVAEWGFEFVR